MNPDDGCGEEFLMILLNTDLPRWLQQRMLVILTAATRAGCLWNVWLISLYSSIFWSGDEDENRDIDDEDEDDDDENQGIVH